MRALAIATAALLALGAAPALAQAPTTRVDYTNPENWLCLPGRADACAVDQSATVVNARGGMSREDFNPARDPRVDCFYVYPTVLNDPGMFSDMRAGPEERRVIASQFARFGSVCRTFAPLYRQLTLAGLRNGLADEAGSAQITAILNGRGPVTEGGGYADVREAWRHYMATENQGRGVILIGHSQGTMHLMRLLAEEIEGTPVQSQIVSAFLLGGNFQVPPGQNVGGTLKQMPLCRADDQTGCVIAYSSFRDTLPPGPGALFGQGGPGTISACVNPANLRRGTGEPESYFQTGTTRWTNDPLRPVGTPFVRTPGLVTTTCVSGAPGTYLQVHVDANPKDARTDDIPGDILNNGDPDPSWGLHLIDINLSLGNLIDIAERQARRWRPAR